MHKPDVERPMQKQVTVGIINQDMAASTIQTKFQDSNTKSKDRPASLPQPSNEKQVLQMIPNLTQAFQGNVEDIKKLELPAHPTKYREEFDRIERARRNLHTVVDNYFRQVSETYMAMISKNPSAELKEILNDRLERNLTELENFRVAGEKNSLSQADLDVFNDRNYPKQVTETAMQIRNVQDNKQEPGAPLEGKDFGFPRVKVDERNLEVIFRNLTDYVSTTFPGNFSPENQEQLIIDLPDYFLNQERVLATVNDHHKTISLFNINAPRVAILSLANKEELPYSHSLIVTPNSLILLSGGVYMSNGTITNVTYSFDTSSVSLASLAPMNVKRVGHSLVFACKQENSEGEIYAIGGRVDQTVRTKLCERYNVAENKWERIANLNHARSRCAAANFDNKFIYAFFGTDSFDNNVTSIERYSIELNHWDLINAVNTLPGLEVTFAGACQINKNQIILLGGFSESEQFQDFPTSNHRIATFNVANDTFNVLNNVKLPGDFSLSNSSSPMVIGGVVYCVGHFFQSTHPVLKRALDCDYVLKVDKASAELKSIMLSDKAYAKVDRSQRQGSTKKENEPQIVVQAD